MYGFEPNCIAATRKNHTYCLGNTKYGRRYVDPAPDVAVQIESWGITYVFGRSARYILSTSGLRYTVPSTAHWLHEPGRLVVLTPASLKSGNKRDIILEHLWEIK